MAARVRQGWHHFGKGRHIPAGYGLIAKNILFTITANNDLEAIVKVGPSKRIAGIDYKLFWVTFLEFGTKRMTKRAFIRPAFEARKGDVLAEFSRALREGLIAEGLKLN